jgi:16S rRNA (cytosine1402-N4)-methyltransferase
MAGNNYHKSVLLQEAIENLQIQKGSKYIDATMGGAGHTTEILKNGGSVLSIDADQDAIDNAAQKFSENEELAKYKYQLTIAKGNFKDIKDIAQKYGFNQVHGILFDLGVSSHQFDIAERGFSFMREGPLDMRMDRDLKVQAKDLINSLTKGELYELFTKLGEEWRARTIAEHIIRSRQLKPIETTTELAEIVKKAVPSQGDINPATKIFQALRIAINDELNSLREALPKAVELLQSGGRLAIISFHSLEDRIVKQEFIRLKNEEQGEIITKKPIIPTEEEIRENKRSRSAKLRVFQKI